MSWCRFGSPCTGTLPAFEDDLVCGPGPCPGSDLYVFESTSGGIECCGCWLASGGAFVAQTPKEMADHIEAHVAAGHHVRPSLRRGAPRKLTAEWEAFFARTERL